MLFCGTKFASVQDRRAPGQGFTHDMGDVVTIATAKLGALVNRVEATDAIASWSYGAGASMRNRARRALL